MTLRRRTPWGRPSGPCALGAAGAFGAFAVLSPMSCGRVQIELFADGDAESPPSASDSSPGGNAGSSPDAQGTAVAHTMTDCDSLAVSDPELVLPLTKASVTKPLLPATPTDPACIVSAAVSTPDETQTSADTARIAAALKSACPVVKLVASGANNAFISGPLDIVGPEVLWIDTGVTLYASLDADLFASEGRTSCGAQDFDEDCDSTGGTQCTALINMSGSGPQLVGAGTIDGQGGKPIIVGGTQQSYSWWDLSAALRSDDDPDAGVNPSNCGHTPAAQRGGSPPNPQLIIGGAKSTGASDRKTANLVIVGLTLHNSPKFHVKFSSDGFTVWGNTILTPSDKSILPSSARNTDGIDPGEGYLATNGAIVCNMISTGDDDIGLKGHYGVGNVVVAHNHFGSGGGIAIGSETQGVPGLTATDTAAGATTGLGIQDVDIYDVTIDGDTRSSGGPKSDIGGVRIKSDISRGGIVQNTLFHDICLRDIVNPISINPHYSAATATPPLIPYFKGITIRNLHAVSGSSPDGSIVPTVMLAGSDSAHPTNVTLDNVLVEGITPANVIADPDTPTVTLNAMFAGQGANFAVPPQLMEAGSPTGNPCDWGWPVPRPN
ncbi:MAG: glycosyl hydrolase family 28 protein [Polyangiaceae bacterium]